MEWDKNFISCNTSGHYIAYLKSMPVETGYVHSTQAMRYYEHPLSPRYLCLSSICLLEEGTLLFPYLSHLQGWSSKYSFYIGGTTQRCLRMYLYTLNKIGIMDVTNFLVPRYLLEIMEFVH